MFWKRLTWEMRTYPKYRHSHTWRWCYANIGCLLSDRMYIGCEEVGFYSDFSFPKLYTSVKMTVSATKKKYSSQCFMTICSRSVIPWSYYALVIYIVYWKFTDCCFPHSLLFIYEIVNYKSKPTNPSKLVHWISWEHGMLLCHILLEFWQDINLAWSSEGRVSH